MKRLALILGLATFSTPALAAPISFTGAELANLPGITFPTGTQTIIGDSLRIDATLGNSVIASLPLSQFNVDVRDFEVQINVTRLLNDASNADQDYEIYLSDGLNLFGGHFVDIGDIIQARIRRDELNSDRQIVMFKDLLAEASNVPVSINSSYLATIGVQSTATSTTITTEVNNGASSITASTPILFNASNGGPSLALFSNSPSENYQINTVTFTRGVSVPTAVAEPGALGGLALGLATLGFGVFRRRFV